jgi:hypothetical protein
MGCAHISDSSFGSMDRYWPPGAWAVAAGFAFGIIAKVASGGLVISE